MIIDKKNKIYIARTPFHLIGWSMIEDLGIDEQGRLVIIFQKNDTRETRMVHCEIPAIPISVLQRYE